MLFGLGPKAWAAISAVIVVGGGIAIAGAVIADDGDFDPISAPEWKAGYTYSYAVDAELETVYDASENLSGFIGQDIPPELDVAIGPLQLSKQVLNTQYKANGQPTYVSAANVPLTNIQQGGFPDFQNADQVQAWPAADRQADLAPLWVQPDWDCRSNGCDGGGLQFGQDNPFTYLAFPLTEGKRWTQEAELPMLEDLGQYQQLTSVHMVGEVGQMESIDLGGDLGSTDAVRVDFSYTPIGMQEFVNAMAKEAENAGFDLERFDVQLGLHEVVHYSPEYEAVVRDQWIIRGLVDLAFEGEIQGYQLDEFVYTEFNAIVTAQLNGADLDPKGEKSPLQILEILGDKQLVDEAVGNAPERMRTQCAGCGIDLASSVRQVNAADGDEVSLHAGLAGVDSLPDGHSLNLEVVDSEGQVVDNRLMDGPTLSYSFADPGAYTLLVRWDDGEGRLVAQDDLQVVADYATEIAANCGSLYGCDPEPVPVRAGIEHLIVEADARDVVDLQQGSLYLVTSDGTTLSGDGDDRIELTGEELQEFALGDWEVRWENYAGISESVDYVIDLDYGTPAFEAQVSGDGNASGGDSADGGPLGMLGGLMQAIETGFEDVDQGQIRLDLSRVI